MATSPFGGFADLSKYQRAAAAPQMNPLESLISGFQTGSDIANLPQNLADQAVLKKQQAILNALKVASAQRALYDQLHPEEAMNRELSFNLKKALMGQQLEGGNVVTAAVPGETTYLPGAITEAQQANLTTEPELTGNFFRDALNKAATQNAPLPTAPQGIPEKPILDYQGKPTAFNLDVQGALADAKRKQDAEINLLGRKEEAKAAGKRLGEGLKQATPTVVQVRYPDGSFGAESLLPGQKLANGAVPANYKGDKADEFEFNYNPQGQPVFADKKNRKIYLAETAEGYMPGRPASAVGGGKDFERTASLSKQFDAKPAVKDFNEIRSKYEDIGSQVRNAKSNPKQFAGDAAIVDRFAAIVNPKGRVTQGQVQLLFKGRNLASDFATRFDRLLSGEGGALTQDERNAILQASKDIYRTHQKEWIREKADYTKRAKEAGLDPIDIVGSSLPIFDSEGEARSNGAKSGEIILLNGRRFQLD